MTPDDIEGWLTHAEGQCLLDLANKANGLIVEIGAWKGRSTSWLLLSGKSVITVDHFEGSSEHHSMFGPNLDTYAEFRTNMDAFMQEHGGNLQVLRMDSLEAAKIVNEPIGLLFVDGSHEYEYVSADLRAWLPKVKGVVAVHDRGSSGPKRAIAEYVDSYSFVDSLAFWKV